MASIDSLTFDQASYAPGALISLTVGYTPDSPTVVPVTFTSTTVISDPAGNQLASASADFVVDEAQASGDTLAVTDTGSRTWMQASNDGKTAVFTATA